MSISNVMRGPGRVQGRFQWMWGLQAAALLLLACAGVGADDDIDAFFREFKEKRDDIGALRAEFVQRTFLPEEVVMTEGVVHYSRPRRILFETRDPELAILVDGRRGYEYDAEIRQVTVFDIEDHPRADIFFMGFDDDADALRQAYDVSLLIVDDPRGRQGVKITPREDAEAYFMEVNLYLRDEDYLPYRIHIVNDAESQLFLDIEEIETSAAPNLDQARILVPEGVVIIMDDRIVDRVDGEGRHLPLPDTTTAIEERDLPPLEDDTEQ